MALTLGQAALIKHGYIFTLAENGTGSLHAQMLDDAGGVRHSFSARCGGVSKAPYESLNLSWSRMESFETAKENFQRFCDAFGYDYAKLTIINYEHGNKILPVTHENCGQGFGLEALPFCDGLISNDPEVTLVTSHADCGVIFFYDPVKRAVGIVHAGWKGTLLRIGAKAVEAMAYNYGSKAENIIAAVGPCICRACFEVDMSLGLDFAKEFDDEDIFSHGKPGKAQLDLERAAAIQLIDAGVLPQNITLMHACTYHNEDMFFSYRRDHGETGSMSGFISLT